MRTRRPRTRRPASFYETLTRAVAEFATTGYVDEARLTYWIDQIRAAAERDMVPEDVLVEQLRRNLTTTYERVASGAGARANPDISRFTLQDIKPRLRDELSRRVMASADLIRLNRENAIADTLQRFAGWATSVPPGGAPEGQQRAATAEIRRSLASLPFRERRVAIDQGQKLLGNLQEILARDSGAIAAKWRHNWVRYPRHQHVARDGKIYVMRDSWAYERGLVRPGPAGFYEDITKPGEEVFCRCSAVYIHSLGRLSEEMLTSKGKAELAKVRGAA